MWHLSFDRNKFRNIDFAIHEKLETYFETENIIQGGRPRKYIDEATTKTEPKTYQYYADYNFFHTRNLSDRHS